jgi:tRNA 2-thiouridine synthesizing protein B
MNMHVGFILTKSPSEQGFDTFLKFACLYLFKNQISIYLVGNGVYSARKNHVASDKLKKILQGSKIYANNYDLEARGIKEEELIEGIIPFYQYDQMVIDIMENFDQILSF